MKDINFFKPYLKKKHNKSNNKLLIFIVSIISITSIVSYGVFNELKINKLTEKMLEAKEIAEEANIRKKIQAINLENKKIIELKLEVDTIKKLKSEIDKKNYISSEYINSIISRKPKDLFLTSITIDTEHTNIEGIADNKLSIAEFAKGLEEVENLKSLLIPNIKKEERDYRFNLESSLIEEEEDEIMEEVQDKQSKD